MRLPFVIAAVVLASVPAFMPAGVHGSVTFDDYFIEGALRVDIIHSGTGEDEEVSVRRVLREPLWAGPRTGLIPLRDMGRYRLDLADVRSGEVIYRQGYSTLFSEWQTTEEALTTRRAFEETLETPLPRDSVVLRVLRRTREGVMDPLFSVTIDPKSHLIGVPRVPAGAAVIGVEVNGRPEDKVDLLILGDGYAAGDRQKFERDCMHFMENFFGTEPFKTHRASFNVHAVFVPSRDSGIDEPRKGIYRDTPFGITFDMFGLPRYCMTEALWAIHDAASLAPHDAILLMANSSRYGGGAIYNFYTVFVSDNEYDDYLPVHEFGHGFGGLGDEYYTSAVAYSEFHPHGVEPWEPNITALLDKDRLKWRVFVDPGTPVPTPEDERYAGKIGAFEGAGYAAKGLYRPAIDCKMFSKGNREFCEVCEEAMIEAIRYYAPE